MSVARHLACLGGVLLWLSASAAAAEEAAEPSSVEPAPARTLSYEEYRRSELQYLAKRSQRWLIGSSAAAAAGVALVTPAFVNECVRVASSASFDDVRCSGTGRVLLGVGLPLLIAGATGVLVTAIMLGVRRGHIRHIDHRLAYEKSRAFRWDRRRAALVF